MEDFREDIKILEHLGKLTAAECNQANPPVIELLNKLSDTALMALWVMLWDRALGFSKESNERWPVYQFVRAAVWRRALSKKDGEK